MMQVRPGRECQVCGENDRAKMANHAASKDGHRLFCGACHSLENGARYAAVRAEVGYSGAAATPETRRASKARYARANPDAVRAAKSAWRNVNHAYMRAWAAAHPEVGRNAQARRRSRLAGATCDPTLLPPRANCPCGAAGQELDHVVPVSRGGCANAHNLQWLCMPCNRAKSASLPTEGAGCPAFWTMLAS